MRDLGEREFKRYWVKVNVPEQTINLMLIARDDEDAFTRGSLGWGYPHNLNVTEVSEVIERPGMEAYFAPIADAIEQEAGDATIIRADQQEG